MNFLRWLFAPSKKTLALREQESLVSRRWSKYKMFGGVLVLLFMFTPQAFADSFNVSTGGSYTNDTDTFSWTATSGDVWCWWLPNGTYGGQFTATPGSGSGTFASWFGNGIAGTYHIGGYGDPSCAGFTTSSYAVAFAGNPVDFSQVTGLGNSVGAFTLTNSHPAATKSSLSLIWAFWIF